MSGAFVSLPSHSARAFPLQFTVHSVTRKDCRFSWDVASTGATHIYGCAHKEGGALDGTPLVHAVVSNRITDIKSARTVRHSLVSHSSPAGIQCDISNYFLIHALRMPENRILRKVIGPKGKKMTGKRSKLLRGDLHSLNSSTILIRVIKSRGMRQVGMSEE